MSTRAGAPLAAYVLHSWDWSESSLILDLFTRSAGRVVAIAKGAKKPTSNFRPVLLPFHPLAIWLSKASADEGSGDGGEVRTLRAAEWGGGRGLAGAALMPGFYCNELVQRGLARQDPHPRLFDAYADTLEALALPAGGAGDEAAVLRAFELVLLREMGVLPALDVVTLSAEPVRAEGLYELRPDAGVAPTAASAASATVRDERTGALRGEALVMLQAALDHGSTAALRHACAPVAAALRLPLRGLVHYHLGTSQLRTRAVWLDVQRIAGPAGVGGAAAER